MFHVDVDVDVDVLLILSIFVPKDPPKDFSEDPPGESKIPFFPETKKLKILLSLACQLSFLRLDLPSGDPLDNAKVETFVDAFVFNTI